MAEYLILIYEDEKTGWHSGDQTAMDTTMAGHQSFGATHGSVIKGGNALHATSSATSIRRDGGEPVVTDGPFAESKEALGGYYLVEAPDLDAAIAIAKDCPAPYGGVEVRPVYAL
jgi:hypothetical protein